MQVFFSVKSWNQSIKPQNIPPCNYDHFYCSELLHIVVIADFWVSLLGWTNKKQKCLISWDAVLIGSEQQGRLLILLRNIMILSRCLLYPYCFETRLVNLKSYLSYCWKKVSFRLTFLDLVLQHIERYKSLVYFIQVAKLLESSSSRILSKF